VPYPFQENSEEPRDLTSELTHTGPGGSGLTDRWLAAGYPVAGQALVGRFRTEKIAGGDKSMPAQSSVDQRTGDALHLKTMRSPNLTEIGAGMAVMNGRVYYVIDCAGPTTCAAPQATTWIAGSGSTTPAVGVMMGIIMLVWLGVVCSCGWEVQRNKTPRVLEEYHEKLVTIFACIHIPF